MGNCPPPLLFRSRTGDARAERGAVVALLHHLKCSVISIKWAELKSVEGGLLLERGLLLEIDRLLDTVFHWIRQISPSHASPFDTNKSDEKNLYLSSWRLLVDGHLLSNQTKHFFSDFLLFLVKFHRFRDRTFWFRRRDRREWLVRRLFIRFEARAKSQKQTHAFDLQSCKNVFHGEFE